jgi:glycerophosphoryl diester phosphodiesterase
MRHGFTGLGDITLKRFARYCTTAIAILSGCASISEKATSDTGREITVIAHRGASGHAPENTLAAFRTAVESGADYFELDCRLTRDDQVVILHDGDLERTGGEKVAMSELTFEEARHYDVGAWFSKDFAGERIPTLAESLDAATKDCGVYVEIKSEAGDGAFSAALVAKAMAHDTLTPELRAKWLSEAESHRSVALTRKCIADIRAKKMEKRVVIQSFSPLICFVARAEAPEIRTELLLSDNKDNPGHFDIIASFGILIGVEGINVSKDSLTPERLQRFHDAGKTVAVYTLNAPEEWEHVRALGVDAIITDRPAECIAALKPGA